MIIGMNAHTAGPKTLDKIKEAGVKWVRVDVSYDAEEADIDRLFDRLSKRRLKVYANLGSERYTVMPPQWRKWVRQLVQRHGSQIKAYGIWNEPNNDRFWNGSFNDYMEGVLKPAINAIRNHQPEAIIAVPNLMDRAKWYKWLKNVLMQCHADIDVVAQHFYPDRGRFSSLRDFITRDKRWYEFWREPSLREVVGDYSNVQKIWIAETGVTCYEVGEYGQWWYLEGCIEGLPHIGKVSGFFWYHIKDDPRYPERDFGILSPEGEPKLAYRMLQRHLTGIYVVEE